METNTITTISAVINQVDIAAFEKIKEALGDILGVSEGYPEV